MSDLSSLLKRVEGATKPDDELGARVLCALAAPEGAYVERSKINGVWCIYTAAGRLWQDRAWWRYEGWPITASLDAALALVERVRPGWCWRVECYDTNGAHAAVWPNTERIWSAEAATPALALLAALLRSLETSP